jgi:hypothetical protein
MFDFPILEIHAEADELPPRGRQRFGAGAVIYKSEINCRLHLVAQVLTQRGQKRLGTQIFGCKHLWEEVTLARSKEWRDAYLDLGVLVVACFGLGG